MRSVTPFPATAAVLLVVLTACGGPSEEASQVLDDAMAAVCGDAPVEVVEPEPADGDRPASEAARTCDHGDIVGGDVFVDDPGDWLGDIADGEMTGNGVAVSRTTREVDGRWVVVQARTTGFQSEYLEPLEDEGWVIVGGEDPDDW